MLSPRARYFIHAGRLIAPDWLADKIARRTNWVHEKHSGQVEPPKNIQEARVCVCVCELISPSHSFVESAYARTWTACKSASRARKSRARSYHVLNRCITMQPANLWMGRLLTDRTSITLSLMTNESYQVWRAPSPALPRVHKPNSR